MADKQSVNVPVWGWGNRFVRLRRVGHDVNIELWLGPLFVEANFTDWPCGGYELSGRIKLERA